MIPYEHILQWLTMCLGSFFLHSVCQKLIVLVPPLHSYAPSQSRNEQVEVFSLPADDIIEDTGGTQKQELSRKR